MTETAHEPTMGLAFEKVWAMFEETDRRFKETDRKISKLGGRIEHLMAPNIMEKFNSLGFVFGKTGAKVRFVYAALSSVLFH
jgi:hypothetical protein